MEDLFHHVCGFSSFIELASIFPFILQIHASLVHDLGGASTFPMSSVSDVHEHGDVLPLYTFPSHAFTLMIL